MYACKNKTESSARVLFEEEEITCTKCKCKTCAPPAIHSCSVCERSFPFLHFKERKMCRTCGTFMRVTQGLADEMEEMVFFDRRSRSGKRAGSSSEDDFEKYEQYRGYDSDSDY